MLCHSSLTWSRHILYYELTPSSPHALTLMLFDNEVPLECFLRVSIVLCIMACFIHYVEAQADHRALWVEITCK